MSTKHHELRELLRLWDPPAGPYGFEGMIAVALAAVSDLPVRLARSGSQFGRDGLSTPGDFVLAFEAKRYTDRPTLQEMTTKAALATDDLGGQVELWACALPTDLGDFAARLQKILDREGISLLVLDWPVGGLSPLATLLAGARQKVVEWARGIGRDADADVLDRLLRAFEAESAFAANLARLTSEITSATAGQAALARRNWDWAHHVLSDAKQSRQTLGQVIVPSDPTYEAVIRTSCRQAVAASVHPASEGITVILGGEGSGKSWIAADWWLQQRDLPILLFAAGPQHGALDSEASGEGMIAQLLARQHGELPERWLSRVKRWQRWGNGRVRFALIIDGLNERAAGKKWATILDKLASVVSELGGVIIATCRPQYWRQNVAGRLHSPVMEVSIGDFSREELADFLEKHRLRLKDIPTDLQEFLANPRIAALAVKLLPRLSTLQTLSRDRLLLEYWRARIHERGDLTAHNDEEFRDLLAEHARPFRDDGSTTFARSQLRQLSDQVVFGGRSYDDDLAELAEGHFFVPTGSGYAVTGNALPTALGMLLHKELIGASLTDAASAIAFVDAALEPIAGFDESANAVAACIALAVAEGTLPAFVVASLIVTWFGIQNRDVDACRSISTSARAAPLTFFDAYELIGDEQNDRPFLELLHSLRDDPLIWEAMQPRLALWLGSWTSQAELYGRDDEARARQMERTAGIVAKVNTLQDSELALLNQTTKLHTSEPGLAKAAVQLAIGQPLTALAPAIVGFAFVGALKGHGGTLHPLFCWMLRSNAADFEATHSKVRELIAPLCETQASATAKQAAAIALESLGRREDAEEAKALWPREPGQRWSSVDRVCDVDPLNPLTSSPTNLQNARNVAQSISSAEVWTSFGTTHADHNLDEIRPGLTRFDMPFLASLLQGIIRSGPARREMALRQLSWHLPELSPLFQVQDLDAVRDIIGGLDGDGREVALSDRWWVLAMAVESLLPHLSFADRVMLVKSLPGRVSLFDRLAWHPAKVEAAELEELLVAAENQGPQQIARMLHMLDAVAAPMTGRCRLLVAGWLAHENTSVAALAADVVRRAGDDELDGLALSTDALLVPDGEEFVRANKSAAFASAVVRQNRDDLVSRVALEDLGWVAGQLGGQAIGHYRRAIDAALSALLRPSATLPPENLEIRLETDDDGRDRRLNFDVRDVQCDDPILAFKALTEDNDGKGWEEERRRASGQLREFVKGVISEGAGSLVQSNWLHGLDEVVANNIEHASVWACQILEADASGCDRTQALGAALAAALAPHEPTLAANLFRQVMKANAIVDTLIGRAKIPLRLFALFRAPRHELLTEICVSLFVNARHDEEIEALVIAATSQGADAVLDDLVEQFIASPIPGRQALGLTITGFREPTSATDSLLADDYGPSFLGDVASAARDTSRRARWFEYWRNEALGTDDAVDYWRAADLAARCVDRRGLVTRLELREESPAWLHHRSWLEQLSKGVEKRSKKRRDLLFGLKKPVR